MRPAAYGTADPAAYGEALAQRLLPDLLPYRIGTAAALSFAGTNGRTLADNAPEAMFSLATNTAIHSTGLAPQDTAGTRSSRFPYLVPASTAAAAA